MRLGKYTVLSCIVLPFFFASIASAGPVSLTLDYQEDTPLSLWAWVSSTSNPDTGQPGGGANLYTEGYGSVSESALDNHGSRIEASASIQCIGSTASLRVDSSYQGIGDESNQTSASVMLEWPASRLTGKSYSCLHIGTSSSYPAGTPLELRISSSYYGIDRFENDPYNFEISDPVNHCWIYMGAEDFFTGGDFTVSIRAGDIISVDTIFQAYTDLHATHSGALGFEVQFEVVPEPASLSLLALGGFVFLRRGLFHR